MPDKNHAGNDKHLKAFMQVLEKYQSRHQRAKIDAYRYGPYSIRIRIIDPDFAGVNRMDRHKIVWRFLDELSEETLNHLGLLVLLAPKEKKSSFASLEFDDPVASKV